MFHDDDDDDNDDDDDDDDNDENDDNTTILNIISRHNQPKFTQSFIHYLTT